MFMPLFHLSVVVINSYTLWYDQKYVNFPFRKEIVEQNLPFKNRILFLTLWCLVLQTIYFTIAFLNDIFGNTAPTPRRTSLLRVIKDTVFSLAFPIAIYVSLSFWGIYAVDKELIFPDEVAKVFPPLSNHVMHTFIAPFILLELLLTHRNYPSRKVGVAIDILFMMSYLLVLSLCYVKTGVWVYPVLDVLNWPLRIVFFSVSILSGIGIYILGEKLNYLVSYSPSKEVNGKMKRR